MSHNSHTYISAKEKKQYMIFNNFRKKKIKFLDTFFKASGQLCFSLSRLLHFWILNIWARNVFRPSWLGHFHLHTNLKKKEKQNKCHAIIDKGSK